MQSDCVGSRRSDVGEAVALAVGAARCVKAPHLTGSSQQASEASEQVEPRKQDLLSSWRKSSKHCNLLCNCERGTRRQAYWRFCAHQIKLAAAATCSKCSCCCKLLHSFDLHGIQMGVGIQSHEINPLPKLNIASPSDGRRRMVLHRMAKGK